MSTGDGLLVRVKPRGGVLSPTQAAALASSAVRHGNGTLDLTARANIQIRGVSDAALEFLLQALDAVRLLDLDPDAEAVRNIVASPLAGLGAPFAIDVAADLAALEAMLARETDLQRLPAKWSFVIDDGGAFSLRDVAADIRFEAQPDGTFAIVLGHDRMSSARCRPGEVAPVAAHLCRLAIAGDPVRMDGLVRAEGAAQLLEAAGLKVRGPLPSRDATTAEDLIGDRNHGARPVFGLAPAFGILKADALLALAELADRHGVRSVRLTPWRVVLLPGLPEGADQIVRAVPALRNWIVDPADPRLAVAACSGRPACARGSTPVPADAELLAGSTPRSGAVGGIRVHVSGCAKGCAHPHPAPLTLVGRDGLYDLVLDGKASDKPVAYGLPLQAALRRIEAGPS
ncbi:MAG: precorrin-3B synthase [Gluconacetobacter diazotrophicus]|nr:precorrin-3B synthase [Gluconacetobacter diazotrophicus]